MAEPEIAERVLKIIAETLGEPGRDIALSDSLVDRAAIEDGRDHIARL